MNLPLHIEALVHGGEGLARHQGRVCFVRGAAPGDRVEAEVLADEGRFLRARAVRLIEAGPARVEAPCPLVDACGGCPLQHTSEAAQREEKARLLADALERTGGLARGSFELLPLVPSPAQLRYRRRARLHRAQGGAWGFAGAVGEAFDEEGRALSGGVVPVPECLLFEPALQGLYARVREAAAALGGLPGVADLGLDTSSAGAGAVDLRTEGPASPALHKRAEALLARVKGLRGIALGPMGAPALLGRPVLADEPAAGARARLRSRPDLFAQANRAAVPLLQRAALEALGAAREGRVLELFCGAGTLTLPLLEAGATVLGVEGAGPSLQLLRASAEEAGLAARLRVVAGDAAQSAARLVEAGEAYDAVLLDPPRTGAAEAARALRAVKAPRLVYVSCDAPTLARDARLLAEGGWRLARAQALDLFPQTAHFETVALFVRAGAALG